MKGKASECESIFILGAGFTKAVHQEAPLNADLLNALVSSGNAPRLLRYYEKYKIDDIEKLLTIIDLDTFENQKLKRDRANINKEISEYFSKFRFTTHKSLQHPWLKSIAVEVFKSNDAVVSLNYDCFLEGALDYHEVWTPNGGYARIDNPLAGSIPFNKGVLLYKIHGSENFVESCVGNNRSQTALSFIINPSIFPRSGANSYLSGGAISPRPFIIAPSFVKIPHVDIAALMLEVLEKAETARNLTIIGCGMRPEDNFLWLLLCKFLNSKLPIRKKLIIISPTSDSIWQRISNYWVGDIRKFADVSLIECGMEAGIDTLKTALFQ